jgi:hypothetical protein
MRHVDERGDAALPQSPHSGARGAPDYSGHVVFAVALARTHDGRTDRLTRSILRQTVAVMRARAREREREREREGSPTRGRPRRTVCFVGCKRKLSAYLEARRLSAAAALKRRDPNFISRTLTRSRLVSSPQTSRNVARERESH